MIGWLRDNYSIILTSEHRAAHETLKIDHFSVNCHKYSSFWRYFFVQLGDESRFPARQKSTTIHLNLSE